MTERELITMIETAFAGVTLEDGVGLFESHALDDRRPPELVAAKVIPTAVGAGSPIAGKSVL